MQTSEQSTLPRLPDSWVAKIFATMQGYYGTRWLNMWKIGQILDDGTDAGVRNAMATWATKLGGFASQPERIRHVLENSLPAEPPSLPQFIELLRQAPAKTLPALTHEPTPEEIERNKEAANSIRKAMDTRDHMGWIRRPKSQAELDFAFNAAKRTPSIRAVLAEIIEAGICSPAGILFKFWDGQGWQSIQRGAA